MSTTQVRGMSVGEAIRQRRSIRAFQEVAPPLSVIEGILADAARAASGSNLQPWIIHVVLGEARSRLIEAIDRAVERSPGGESEQYSIFPVDLREPYFSRRGATAAGVYGMLGVKREDHEARMLWRGNNFRFFGAPIGLFCFVDSAFGPGQWSDLGMYLQNVMLLAKEAGLDTCAQEAWSLYNQTVSTQLGVAPSMTLFCGMAIGYADHNQAVNEFVAPRANLAEFCTIHSA
jgi:nitroreductase